MIFTPSWRILTFQHDNTNVAHACVCQEWSGPRARCPSFIVIANGGTSATARALTLKSACTYRRKEQVSGGERGKDAQRRRDTFTMREADRKRKSKNEIAEKREREREAREAEVGNRIDVRSGYATFLQVRIGRCGALLPAALIWPTF